MKRESQVVPIIFLQAFRGACMQTSSVSIGTSKQTAFTTYSQELQGNDPNVYFVTIRPLIHASRYCSVGYMLHTSLVQGQIGYGLCQLIATCEQDLELPLFDRHESIEAALLRDFATLEQHYPVSDLHHFDRMSHDKYSHTSSD